MYLEITNGFIVGTAFQCKILFKISAWRSARGGCKMTSDIFGYLQCIFSWQKHFWYFSGNLPPEICIQIQKLWQVGLVLDEFGGWTYLIHALEFRFCMWSGWREACDPFCVSGACWISRVSLLFPHSNDNIILVIRIIYGIFCCLAGVIFADFERWLHLFQGQYLLNLKGDFANDVSK